MSQDNDNMTPEERLAWLRERGVLVETPEERKAKQVSKIMNEKDEVIREKISYVLIPHDRSKPLQDFSVLLPITAAGDGLVDHLKPVFGARAKDVDLNLFKEKAAVQLGSQGVTVSEETLLKVAEEGNVEVFPLVHATPSNNFTGVNIYLDEVGMLKRLPLNTRASEFAAQAGFHPPPQFYGNVFLGRVQSKPTLRNLSITVGKDTAPDAPWLVKATMENLEHQTSLNNINGRTQEAVDGEGGVAKAEEGYAWTQTEEELEVVVKVPSDTSSKDVSVTFRPQSLEVKVKKLKLLRLELFERVDPDGCTWTFESGGDQKKVVITIEKIEEALWPRIKN